MVFQFDNDNLSLQKNKKEIESDFTQAVTFLSVMTLSGFLLYSINIYIKDECWIVHYNP